MHARAATARRAGDGRPGLSSRPSVPRLLLLLRDVSTGGPIMGSGRAVDAPVVFLLILVVPVCCGGGAPSPQHYSPPAVQRQQQHHHHHQQRAIDVGPSCGGEPGSNATAACLQSAFDAALPGDLIIIPFTGTPLVVGRPLFLRRDGITVHLLAGAVLEAERGGFHGVSDCLLTIGGGDAIVTGVTLRGSAGATLRMHREDYADATRYTKAEWRHGLQLVNVRSTLVDGPLLIERTGGDGIYVDQATNTTVRNVDMSANYRQGMSVIAANGLLVEDCLMRGTNGTNPQAGLDIEPNRPSDELVNLTFSRVSFFNNSGNQVDVFPTCLRYRVCGQAERRIAVEPGRPVR
eukprot:COSAG05_NODE_74_length_21769_cov_194.316290_18_plen_348_part_00